MNRYERAGQGDTVDMVIAEEGPWVLYEDVADRLEQLTTDVALIAKWQAEGERLIEGKGGLMFSLGAWWADRPWRTDRHNV